MENKLEQLLNSLIEKGWLPRGEDKIHSCKFDKRENKFMANYTRSGCFKVMYRSLTELCSKSSGLWQFCEENKMLIGFSPRTRTKNAHETYGSILGDIEYWGSDYEYRLIEASLKDESELEDFLLSNIVIKKGVIMKKDYM